MNLRVASVSRTVLASLLAVLTLGVTGAPLARLGPAASTQLDALPAVTVPPTAGGAVCLTGAGTNDSFADVLLYAPTLPSPSPSSDAGPTDPDAAPATEPDVDDASSAARDARGIVLALREDLVRSAVGPTAPGGLERVRPELGADGWVWTGWADHPFTVWQEWRTAGAPGEPRGAVASRCVPSDAPSWNVLGLRTDGGNESLLRIANPYAADATFAVTLITPEGLLEPIALRNVSVSAGSRITVRVNDHVPEQSDVAAVVTVGAGRVAVEGLQRAVAGVGGVEGVSVVPALTAPSVTWTLPWLPLGPDVDGAVWVLNPESRAVVVQFILHTPQGTAVPEGLDSVEVAAGGLVRIETADLALDGRRVLGMTLRSETTGVVVAAGAQFLDEDPERTGIVRYPAAPAPDPQWSIAGTADAQRDTTLHVVNLAESDAPLRVTVTTSPADGPADTTTTVIEPGSLEPGGVARIVLPLDGAEAWSAVVTGGPALVVSRTTTGRDLLEPVATDATASRTWLAPARVLAGHSLHGWVARLGTTQDLRRDVRLSGADDGQLTAPVG